MTPTDRKRTRSKVESPDITSALSSDSTSPAYGSQEYWEQRYWEQQHKKIKESESFGADGDDDGQGGDPEAFHAWYFSYEELAPLILPLIIGEEVGEMDGDDQNNGDDDAKNLDGDASISTPGLSSKEPDSGGTEEKGDEEDIGEEEQDEIEEEEEEEEEESPPRPGLAKNGPIEILEVGCGDVPLGRDILNGILQLEKEETTVVATKILKRVVCMDYAETVIQAMKANEPEKGSIPLVYECADARKMQYADESFEFVLEKGTMDAMLSDAESGSDNCRAIVAEMARVLSVGGCILVVSHINAHVQSGVDWLDSIVVPGLRKGAGSNKWHIEVHGGEAPEAPDGDNEESPESPGPAVYFIHKGERISISSSAGAEEETPSIPLRFFSY